MIIFIKYKSSSVSLLSIIVVTITITLIIIAGNSNGSSLRRIGSGIWLIPVQGCSGRLFNMINIPGIDGTSTVLWQANNDHWYYCYQLALTFQLGYRLYVIHFFPLNCRSNNFNGLTSPLPSSAQCSSRSNSEGPSVQVNSTFSFTIPPNIAARLTSINIIQVGPANSTLYQGSLIQFSIFKHLLFYLKPITKRKRSYNKQNEIHRTQIYYLKQNLNSAIRYNLISTILDYI